MPRAGFALVALFIFTVLTPGQGFMVKRLIICPTLIAYLCEYIAAQAVLKPHPLCIEKDDYRAVRRTCKEIAALLMKLGLHK